MALSGVPGTGTIVALPSLTTPTLMGKKLKNLWRNRKRVFSTILLWVFRLGVPGGIAWIVFLLLRHIYPISPVDFGLEKRIAFVSLWVAIVGFSLAVLGTILAVMRFQASQREPDLRLWINKVGQRTAPISEHAKTKLHLVLENRGNGVGRYIKCRVRFFVPENCIPLVYTDHRGREKRYFQGIWAEHWELSRESNYSLATFAGKDDFVSYDKNPEGDTIGVFRVRNHTLSEPEYEVRYELRCEGMERKRGKLWIEVPQTA